MVLAELNQSLTRRNYSAQDSSSTTYPCVGNQYRDDRYTSSSDDLQRFEPGNLGDSFFSQSKVSPCPQNPSILCALRRDLVRPNGPKEAVPFAPRSDPATDYNGDRSGRTMSFLPVTSDL